MIELYFSVYVKWILFCLRLKRGFTLEERGFTACRTPSGRLLRTPTQVRLTIALTRTKHSEELTGSLSIWRPLVALLLDAARRFSLSFFVVRVLCSQPYGEWRMEDVEREGETKVTHLRDKEILRYIPMLTPKPLQVEHRRFFCAVGMVWGTGADQKSDVPLFQWHQLLLFPLRYQAATVVKKKKLMIIWLI